MFNIFNYAMLIGILAYLFKDIVIGRSIGKALFGLHIKDYQNVNDLPPFYRLILRNLLIFIWPVELIAILIDKDNRRLGDRLGKTRVIGYSEKVVSRVVIVGVLAFVLFVSSLFIGITQMIRSDSSYQVAVKYIESQEQIKSVTGRITGYGYFPSGSINMTNGHGIAELNIKVKGENEDLTVFVLLEKRVGSEWQVKDIKY